MMRRFAFVILSLIALWAAPRATAQSSSLYVDPPAPVATAPVRSMGPNGPVDHLSPAIAKASFTAIPLPEPKKYALHDLITIVVRESAEAAAQSNLNTSHENNINGELSSFPDMPIINRFIGMFSNTGLNADPRVNLQYKNEFKGAGDYARKDSMATRITAEIIDIKPNGTLVVEARKFTKTDKEILSIALTGTCRKEDVAADNTILSTQLADLHLTQEHKGEIRGATKKGLFAKAFETLFNF